MPLFTVFLSVNIPKNKREILKILPTIEEDYFVIEPGFIIDAADELGAFVSATEMLGGTQ